MKGVCACLFLIRVLKGRGTGELGNWGTGELINGMLMETSNEGTQVISVSWNFGRRSKVNVTIPGQVPVLGH